MLGLFKKEKKEFPKLKIDMFDPVDQPITVATGKELVSNFLLEIGFAEDKQDAKGYGLDFVEYLKEYFRKVKKSFELERKEAKKNKIEIHVRSIFLQGILLLKHNLLPKKLKKLNKKLMVWKNWLKKNKFSSLQVCLSFVLNQHQLDGIVVGCNNTNQLNQILKLKKIKNNFSLPNLNIRDKKLIDPREWLN